MRVADAALKMQNSNCPRRGLTMEIANGGYRTSAFSCPGIQVDIEDLKPIAVFSGVGLAVSLLLASYGLDLSSGIF